MKYAGLCFDLFNTLVNVARVPEHIGRFTADILGIDRDIWREACFGPAHEISRPTDALETLRKLAHSIDPTISLSRIRMAVEARQRRFDHALQVVEPEVCESLQSLRQQGYRLGLISNASSAEVRGWPNSPLAGLFDSVSFSCECGSQKPQPGIYQQALQLLGLHARECLFVGDGGSDEHRGAHAVGMAPVLLTRHLSVAEIQQRRRQYGDILLGEIAGIRELSGKF